jgi:hypothetical protein
MHSDLADLDVWHGLRMSSQAFSSSLGQTGSSVRPLERTNFDCKNRQIFEGSGGQFCGTRIFSAVQNGICTQFARHALIAPRF